MFVSVLKSDNANGLFGFQSINPIAIQESSNVTVTIQRTRGTFGSATVSWSVYKDLSSVLASNDFLMASGTVGFANGESQKVRRSLVLYGRIFLVFIVILQASLIADSE